MYACNGILFNHESPLRGETFVTRKITRGLRAHQAGPAGLPVSRQLDARRDWGHARDYVEVQWLMLQQDEPDDYVIATGEQHSVREFVDARGGELGIDASMARARAWTRQGDRHVRPGKTSSCGSIRAISGRPRSRRCWATPAKARAKLGWTPEISFARTGARNGARGPEAAPSAMP